MYDVLLGWREVDAAIKKALYGKEFEDFCNEHYEPILRSADRLLGRGARATGDRQYAEDATQETFTKLWDVWNERREVILAWPGYKYNVLSNVIADYYRQKMRTYRLPRPMRREESTDDIDPEEFVRRAIHDLSTRVQDIAIRSFIDGQKPLTIAQELGIAVRTVHNYRSIAAKRIRTEAEMLPI